MVTVRLNKRITSVQEQCRYRSVYSLHEHIYTNLAKCIQNPYPLTNNQLRSRQITSTAHGMLHRCTSLHQQITQWETQHSAETPLHRQNPRVYIPATRNNLLVQRAYGSSESPISIPCPKQVNVRLTLPRTETRLFLFCSNPKNDRREVNLFESGTPQYPLIYPTPHK